MDSGLSQRLHPDQWRTTLNPFCSVSPFLWGQAPQWYLRFNAPRRQSPQYLVPLVSSISPLFPSAYAGPFLSGFSGAHDIVFPISQRGNGSPSCLLSIPAPRNRRESHTVTMLFTQLLVNAGSLKVEHQHTLISYSHSNNLRKSYTHTAINEG